MHERLRRRCRRLERLYRDGVLFAFLDLRLLAGGPVPSATNRLEDGINSLAKRVPPVRHGLTEEHMRRARERVCYMKTDTFKPHPRRRHTPSRTGDHGRRRHRRRTRIRHRQRLERTPQPHQMPGRHRLTKT